LQSGAYACYHIPTSPQSGISSPFSGPIFLLALARIWWLGLHARAIETDSFLPLGGSTERVPTATVGRLSPFSRPTWIVDQVSRKVRPRLPGIGDANHVRPFKCYPESVLGAVSSFLEPILAFIAKDSYIF